MNQELTRGAQFILYEQLFAVSLLDGICALKKKKLEISPLK